MQHMRVIIMSLLEKKGETLIADGDSHYRKKNKIEKKKTR